MRPGAIWRISISALRCIKRRLCDIVYKQMRANAQRLAASPGGHSGAALTSNAADSHPGIDSSDKPQPGPATAQARTDLAAVS